MDFPLVGIAPIKNQSGLDQIFLPVLLKAEINSPVLAVFMDEGVVIIELQG